MEKPDSSPGGPGITRRRLLDTAARLAAFGAAASILPLNLRRVLAAEPVRQGSLRDIKHIVLLMQENRSFDHYFGTMAGVRGFDDASAIVLPNGKSVFHQPDPAHPDGYLLPRPRRAAVAAAGNAGRVRPQGADRGRFRVPCLIVSPWTAGGWVCSQPLDHTSVLQLLEKFTGVKEPNISDWRRRTFGDMVSAFRFDDAGAVPPQLPDTVRPYNRAKYEAANLPKPSLPGADQSVPVQEKGQRKRVPRGQA